MTVIERSDTAGDAHDTEYVKMLKDEAQMETRYIIRISAANWALLAGYSRRTRHIHVTTKVQPG
jgi:hypothetical protein